DTRQQGGGQDSQRQNCYQHLQNWDTETGAWYHCVSIIRARPYFTNRPRLPTEFTNLMTRTTRSTIALTAALLSTMVTMASAKGHKDVPARTPTKDASAPASTSDQESGKKTGDDGVSATLPPPPGSAVTKGGGRLL